MQRPATQCHDGSANSHQLNEEGEVHGYSVRWHRSRQERLRRVHGVNEAGKAELVRPSVARAKLHELIAALPPCVIGMQACSGAHHWGRLFVAHGHTVRLMAPKFVVPSRLSGQAWQERCGRRRRDLRSPAASHHALRARQECGGQSNLVAGDLLSELQPPRRAHRAVRPARLPQGPARTRGRSSSCA